MLGIDAPVRASLTISIRLYIEPGIAEAKVLTNLFFIVLGGMDSVGAVRSDPRTVFGCIHPRGDLRRGGLLVLLRV